MSPPRRLSHAALYNNPALNFNSLLRFSTHWGGEIRQLQAATEG